MCIDSGDGSYGSIANSFYDKNKQFVRNNGIKETIRAAGFGGVDFIECFKLPNLKLSLGNHSVEIPEMVVNTEQLAGAGGHYECNIGLRTLMLYSFVRFTLVDFVLTTGVLGDTPIN